MKRILFGVMLGAAAGLYAGMKHKEELLKLIDKLQDECKKCHCCCKEDCCCQEDCSCKEGDCCCDSDCECGCKEEHVEVE